MSHLIIVKHIKSERGGSSVDIVLDKDLTSLIPVLPMDMMKRFHPAAVKGSFRADLESTGSADQDFLTLLRGLRSMRWQTIASHVVMNHNTEETRFYMEKQAAGGEHGDAPSAAAPVPMVMPRPALRTSMSEYVQAPKRPTISAEAVSGILDKTAAPITPTPHFGFAPRQSLVAGRRPLIPDHSDPSPPYQQQLPSKRVDFEEASAIAASKPAVHPSGRSSPAPAYTPQPAPAPAAVPAPAASSTVAGLAQRFQRTVPAQPAAQAFAHPPVHTSPVPAPVPAAAAQPASDGIADAAPKAAENKNSVVNKLLGKYNRKSFSTTKLVIPPPDEEQSHEQKEAVVPEAPPAYDSVPKGLPPAYDQAATHRLAPVMGSTTSLDVFLHQNAQLVEDHGDLDGRSVGPGLESVAEEDNHVHFSKNDLLKGKYSVHQKDSMDPHEAHKTQHYSRLGSAFVNESSLNSLMGGRGRGGGRFGASRSGRGFASP